jgi:hypothetical protein
VVHEEWRRRGGGVRQEGARCQRGRPRRAGEAAAWRAQPRQRRKRHSPSVAVRTQAAAPRQVARRGGQWRPCLRRVACWRRPRAPRKARGSPWPRKWSRPLQTPWLHRGMRRWAGSGDVAAGSRLTDPGHACNSKIECARPIAAPGCPSSPSCTPPLPTSLCPENQAVACRCPPSLCRPWSARGRVRWGWRPTTPLPGPTAAQRASRPAAGRAHTTTCRARSSWSVRASAAAASPTA